MKAFGCLLFSLFLVYASACTGSEDIIPSHKTDKVVSPSLNGDQALVYTYLDGITMGVSEAATEVNKVTTQQRLAYFVREMIKSQQHWQQADKYWQWYEENLAPSCALTFIRQQYTQTTVEWDYDTRACDRQGNPQSGRCLLGVYQRQDTLHAFLIYHHLLWDYETLNGHHHFQWKILEGDRMYLMTETLTLDSLTN